MSLDDDSCFSWDAHDSQEAEAKRGMDSEVAALQRIEDDGGSFILPAVREIEDVVGNRLP